MRNVALISRIPDVAASPAWHGLLSSIASGKLEGPETFTPKTFQEVYEQVVKSLD